MSRTCRCGHDRDAHQHYRPGTDCGKCYPTCTRYESAAGIIEIAESWLVGKLLVQCGKRANRRGDRHAFNHALAALTAGNMSPSSHDQGCLADSVLASSVQPPKEAQEGWAMLVDTRTGDVVSERRPVVFVEGTLPSVNFHRISVAPVDASDLKVRVELANGQIIESPIGGV